MTKIITLSILLLFIFSNKSKSKTLYCTDKINLKNGLSHNGVSSTLEDSEGLLWIATYDGLNVYNGFTVKTFKNTLEKKILSSNRLRSLAEDRNGFVWIGSDEGIDIYDPQKATFTTIFSKEKSHLKTSPCVTNIQFTSENQVICSTEKEGILLFNLNFTYLGKHKPAAPSNTNLQFYSMIEIDKSKLLFSTNQGLLLFDSEENQFRPILDSVIKYSKAISVIDNENILVLGIKGIFKINYQKKQNKLLFLHKKTFFPERRFSTISLDENKKMWLGSYYKGLLCVNFDEEFENIIDAKTYESKTELLRSSDIFLSKKNNRCWYSTYNEGIFKFSLKENPFHTIKSDRKQKYSLKNNILSTLKYDKNRVFIIANQGEVVLFNTNTNHYEPLPYSNSEAIPFLTPHYIDSKGDIWLEGGLKKSIYRVRKGTSKLEKILQTQKEYSLKRSRVMDEDQYGNLWIGGKNGLWRIEKKLGIYQLKEMTNLIHSKKQKIENIRSIYIDPMYPYIWVGTDYDGLFRISNYDSNEPSSEAVIDQYSSTLQSGISSDFVSSILRDSQGTLWVGTEGGGINMVLNCDKIPTFTALSETNGLSNNVVKGMFEDENSNMWITTNKGLNKFSLLNQTFQRIRPTNGLPFEDFEYSISYLNNGKAVLASSQRFCYFDPCDIASIENTPNFHFGELVIGNKLIAPLDTINERVLITSKIQNDSQIVLKHDENIFSIEINSLHYSVPEDYYYQYRMIGLNTEWITQPTSKRFINFTGLSSGKYTLEVRVSNSLKQWSDIKRIEIIVEKPFWKSNYAFFICAILFLVIVLIIIRIRINVINLKHKIEIETIQRKKREEMDEEKFKFFSNISHEFKTPLTLIAGPVDLLLEKHRYDKYSFQYLDLIKRQSKKMSQLVDQVHDFRRADKNMLSIEKSLFSFQKFLKDSSGDFEIMARNTNKTFIIENTYAKILVNADIEKIEKIWNNVVNNAFKYTTKGDEIIVTFEVVKQHLILSIKDTGKGIAEQDLPFVFDRFYQSKRKDKQYFGGSGIGLAFTKHLVELHDGTIEIKSEDECWTKVTIHLPIVHNEIKSSKNKNQIKIKTSTPSFKNTINKIGYSRELESSGKFSNTVVHLIEDDNEIRFFLKSILDKHFIIRSFSNAKTFQKHLLEEWPDIVISDVLMPEISGLELCSEIKNDIRTAHIPVILLTACISKEENLDGLRRGADCYIKKPFDVQYLLTSIENILNNRKLLRERFMGDFSIGLDKKIENSSDNEFLDKLCKLMTDNIDNSELDISSFATELGLNRTHFYQKVKALTNETPYELLKNFRLKKASEYLAKGKMNVSEVSVITGFKNRAHFSRIFKQKFGITPSKYTSEKI